jgi:uncharacterized protein YacL
MSMKAHYKARLYRWFFMIVGPAIVCCGILYRPSIEGKPFPIWRSIYLVLVGLVMTWAGARYYSPANRRKREEFVRILNEAEAESDEWYRSELARLKQKVINGLATEDDFKTLEVIQTEWIEINARKQ